MDFKKYLIVLVFFVVGVFIGKMLPTNTAVDNTAATSRTQPSVAQPVVNTNSGSRAVTTPSISTDLRGGGAGVVAPTDPNIRVQNTPITSKYVGISSLSKNLYRGNIFNDTEQVKSLQKFLVAHNLLTGVADGKFGPMTQSAVINFQNLYAISPAIGYVGPTTRQYINDIISGDPLGRAKPNCNCDALGGGKGYYSGSACQWHDSCNGGVGRELNNNNL